MTRHPSLYGILQAVNSVAEWVSASRKHLTSDALFDLMMVCFSYCKVLKYFSPLACLEIAAVC